MPDKLISRITARCNMPLSFLGLGLRLGFALPRLNNEVAFTVLLSLKENIARSVRLADGGVIACLVVANVKPR
ncbi:MAG: hypothetical protein AAFX78_01025 [Cyanobacteria bacterium J06638_20]